MTSLARLVRRTPAAGRVLATSLRRDPARRRDPGMAAVALGLRYPYRHWLRTDRRRRAAAAPPRGVAPQRQPALRVVLPRGPGREATLASLRAAGVTAGAATGGTHRDEVVESWMLTDAEDHHDAWVLFLAPGDRVERDLPELVARAAAAAPLAEALTWDVDRWGRAGPVGPPAVRPTLTPVGLAVGNPWGRSFAFRAGALRRLADEDGAPRTGAPVGSPQWCAATAAAVLARAPTAARVPHVAVHEAGPRTSAAIGASGPMRPAGGGGRAPVGLVVPSRGDRGNLDRLFEGLAGTPGAHAVVVVDNSEPDDRMEAFYAGWSDRIDLDVVRTDPAAAFNYSAANNLGAAHVRSWRPDVVVLGFCNDDLEVLDPGWLEALSARLDLPGVGVVGPQLRYADDTIQHGGVVIGLNGLAEHAFVGLRPDTDTLLGGTSDPRAVSAVTGACLLTTTEVFDAVGGFDDDLVLTGSDVWFCLRAGECGWQTLYDGSVALVHHESVSRGGTNHLADVVGSERRWGHLVDAGDPFWSPSLAIDSHEPRLRRPEDPTSRQMLDGWLRDHGVAP